MNGSLIFILVLGTLSSGVSQTSTARGRDQGTRGRDTTTLCHRKHSPEQLPRSVPALLQEVAQALVRVRSVSTALGTHWSLLAAACRDVQAVCRPGAAAPWAKSP